ELQHTGVELRRERRDARDLMRAGGDDGVTRTHEVATDLGHKALALAAEPRDAGTHAHVETAPARVALLIVRDLLLAWERVGAVGEAQTGERVHETRGEEPQRRPALAPRVADPRLCIDDECTTAMLLQPRGDAEA